ncbi:MAG: tRNA(adenine34) deaminase [Methylophagaceae bacterium]|jgi:tRNA(adenine34) deaminase
MTLNDTKWMQYALSLAEKAQQQGEVPVGAVIIQNDALIGEGWNQPISTHDPTAHAEIQAIRSASININNYRLPNTTLYVTLEPCLMCAGAIIHSRIERLIYAAMEPKAGAAGSCFHVLDDKRLNHHVQCEQGLLAEESSHLLRQFFKARR